MKGFGTTFLTQAPQSACSCAKTAASASVSEQQDLQQRVTGCHASREGFITAFFPFTLFFVSKGHLEKHTHTH